MFIIHMEQNVKKSMFLRRTDKSRHTVRILHHVIYIGHNTFSISFLSTQRIPTHTDIPYVKKSFFFLVVLFSYLIFQTIFLNKSQ